MKKAEAKETCWTMCQECQGQGKKSRRLRKKVKLHYQMACDAFEKTNGDIVLRAGEEGETGAAGTDQRTHRPQAKLFTKRDHAGTV